ncbi:MAG: hypothetical protein KBH12_06210 [Synergistaceae bacterium]|nr:hypothetical protein [Synergistaceae bacterium]MBP9625751.1 hypothetical protein [Synergistaceae bacterium]MBP9957869.1 hypothetical protein [Synergistaceae bacterium]
MNRMATLLCALSAISCLYGVAFAQEDSKRLQLTWNDSQPIISGQNITYRLKTSGFVPGFFTINTIDSENTVRSRMMLKKPFGDLHVGRMRIPLLSSGVAEVSAFGSYPMTLLTMFVLMAKQPIKLLIPSVLDLEDFDSEFFSVTKTINVFPRMWLLKSIYAGGRYNFDLAISVPVGAQEELSVRGVFWTGETREIHNGFLGTTYTPMQKGIIKVSKDGVITALHPGETTLTIRNGRQATTLPIEVREP